MESGPEIEYVLEQEIRENLWIFFGSNQENQSTRMDSNHQPNYLTRPDTILWLLGMVPPTAR